MAHKGIHVDSTTQSGLLGNKRWQLCHETEPTSPVHGSLFLLRRIFLSAAPHSSFPRLVHKELIAPTVLHAG
eukprot:3787820-Pleurochrysis_carterae.AAC.2